MTNRKLLIVDDDIDDAKVTHGVCPTCMATEFGSMDKKAKRK